MVANHKILIAIGVCSAAIAGGYMYVSKKTPPSPTPTASASAVILVDPPIQTTTGIASISAQAAVVYDVASGQVIYGWHEHERHMPASTTKMMTALVALSEYDPNEIVTISRAADAIGHAVDIKTGEQLTVLDLVKAMLINSGNDAAIALADHHPQGYNAFINAMNQQVIALGLKDTHFSNVSGVEADDHYSSAFDLACIANFVMQNPTIRDIVGTKETTITSIDKQTVHQLKNLNELLWSVPGVIGIKTGWTEVAGDCLVTYVTRDHHDIITVVLKSQDRFADSKTLIDWTFRSFTWR